MDYFKILRPKHWVKNFLVFAPLYFANAFNLISVATTIVGFIVFCLVASSIYIINDLIDYEKDRTNPHKLDRPIAKGTVKKKEAITICILCLLIATVLCISLPIYFTITLLIYSLMNVAYMLKLKNLVIIDVICLALGGVMRIVAGGFLANVEVTKWILVCVFFLGLFMGFSKRRGEVAIENENSIKRKVAVEYSLNILDKFIISSGILALICYALFTLDANVIEKFNAPHLYWTIPFPTYGIFKYTMLIPKTENTDPTHILYKDKSLILFIVIWLAVIYCIMYFGL